MRKQYYISENINEGSFEELDNIKTYEMKFDGKEMLTDGFPLISDGHIARGYASEQPTMVVAATGSGKTRRLIIPYMISCIMSGASFVANDPKGELLRHVKPILERYGYKVLIMNYRDPATGEGYNFCELPAKLYKAGNKARADELFQSLFFTFMETVKSDKDPFWHTTSAIYLAGLAELACEQFPLESISINNIFDLHIQGSMKFRGTTYLNTYMDKHKDKSYYKLIAPYISAPDVTRSSLESVLTSAMAKFCRNESIIAQNAKSTFNISEFVENKTALFVISRDESTVYNAFISAMINQIYEAVIDLAEERYGGALERRLVFILDEFGNLAPIPDINAKITVSRSRNVGWVLGCQSLDQLRVKYDEDNAKIIIGNCSIAYMYSNDIILLKMLSALCGKTTDEHTHETKPLLSVEQLRHFSKDEGQTLFLLERKRPFIGFLPDISDYNVVPVQSIDFTKREVNILPTIDLQEIVKEEKRIEVMNMSSASKTKSGASSSENTSQNATKHSGTSSESKKVDQHSNPSQIAKDISKKDITESKEKLTSSNEKDKSNGFISLDDEKPSQTQKSNVLDAIQELHDNLENKHDKITVPAFGVIISSYGESRKKVANAIAREINVSYATAYYYIGNLPARISADTREEAISLLVSILFAGGKAKMNRPLGNK